jgi:ABC-type multidrug transport system fused ATPase/permease subunit
VIKIDILLTKFQVQPSRFLEFAIFGLILVGVLFIAKSTFSVFLNKMALNNISIIAKDKMNAVTNQYLGQPISVINKRDLHLDANTLTFGSDYLIEGIQSRIQIWSEGLLFVSMLVFLGIVDIYLCLFFTGFFTLMLVLLSKFVSSKQEVVSKKKLENTIDTYRNVIASVAGYKEVKVSGNLAKVITRLGQNRNLNRDFSSKFLFLVNLPKQLIEISLYLVLVLILFFLLAISSNALDPAKLVLFLVAGVRLIPSSIRLNSGLAALRNSKVGLTNLRKMNLEVAPSTLEHINSD